MSRRILKSQSGLTFIELLVTLMVFTMLTSLVIGYLINSMNNFKRVNEEIALHDEANYVMSQMVNYIFVAKDVKLVSDSTSSYLIEVTSFEDKKTIVGFACNKAVIATDYGSFTGSGLDCTNNKFKGIPLQPISNDYINFIDYESDKTEISIDHIKDTVKIEMVLENEQSKYRKPLVLNSEVSFVHVE
ncbi:PilW family protein [Bacillus marasmi]|uniref:PilW family protein n=1 Tax=Bacillus marasmi TaxID=1926279 RepID=UPI0011CCD817|nr:hypothetical protein [Bacillus marasmi]